MNALYYRIWRDAIVADDLNILSHGPVFAKLRCHVKEAYRGVTSLTSATAVNEGWKLIFGVTVGTGSDHMCDNYVLSRHISLKDGKVVISSTWTGYFGMKRF